MSRTPPGHETTDANPRALLIFLIVLVIGGAAIFTIVWATLHYLQRQSPETPTAALPPEPRLQPSPGHPNLPEQDMDALRLHWQTQLNEYAWVDRSATVARIPLARAEEILITHGLPVRLPATNPTGGAP